MKILIISTNYTPELTGIGKYSGEMAEWLAEHGHEVTVVCAPPYYPEWMVQKPYVGWKYKKEELNGVSVIRCPIWVPESVSGAKRMLHLLSFAISSFPVLIAQIFKRHDVVFSVEPSFLNSFSGVLVAKLSMSKSILHVQDFEIDVAFELGIIKNKFLKGMLLWAERKVMSMFDVVSTSSEAMVAHLLRKSIPGYKTYLFPNWVDTSKIFPLNRKGMYRDLLSIPDDYTLVLYSGNMGEKQGLELIIDVATFLKSEKITFLMCGAGAALKRLKESSAHLSNVLWIDLQPLDSLNELLNSADIHLLPQLVGAADLLMPSKLNGMLSSGKPIVATAELDTQVAKVVSSCGVVTPPGDMRGVAEAILLLANNSKFASKLGAAARSYAEYWLECEVIMSRFDSLLSGLKGAEELKEN